jgi:NADH dehydrogenase FAD-containing subunit
VAATGTPPPFAFRNYGMLAYLGGWTALADTGKAAGGGSSGRGAWLLWRSAYFTMTVSWRNKILIPVYWMVTWLFGRDIGRL